jgi:hemoglobin-like flavoprotein
LTLPPLLPRQIALVRQSWVKVQPIADEIAAAFYDRLFAAEPAMKALFRGDLREHGRQLLMMMAVALHGLERVDSLASLQDLGARHARYGARREHFEPFGAAFIATLEDRLGDAFTAEVKDAWAAVYRRLARRMGGG